MDKTCWTKPSISILKFVALSMGFVKISLGFDDRVEICSFVACGRNHPLVFMMTGHFSINFIIFYSVFSKNINI